MVNPDTGEAGRDLRPVLEFPSPHAWGRRTARQRARAFRGRWRAPGRPTGCGGTGTGPVGALLAPGPGWCQLPCVTRSPIGTFTSLVIPVALPVSPYLVTAEMTLQSGDEIAVV